MTKIILSLVFLLSSLSAELINAYPSQEILNSKTPIVDVRTPREWKETGILKDSIPIMFYNEKGGYNIEAFLDELNSKVDTKKPFAIVCRTGRRTSIIGAFLSQKLHYNVINLKGGIVFAKTKNLPIVPYK